MTEENPLILDIGEKWQRIDAYVGKLTMDEELQKHFFKKPNELMSDLGIHHSNSDKPTAITNRIFYHIIGNRELMNLVIENRDYIRFHTKQNQNIRIPRKQQEVPNHVRSKDLKLKPYLKYEKFLRKCIVLLLHDLQKNGIINKKLSRKQIMSYVEKVVAHPNASKPFGKTIPSMRYQSHYLIEKKYNSAKVDAVVPAESEAEAHASFDARSDAGAEGAEADAESEAEAHASFDARSDGTNTVTPRSFDLRNKDLVNLVGLTDNSKESMISTAAKLSEALSFASDLSLLVQYLEEKNFSIR